MTVFVELSTFIACSHYLMLPARLEQLHTVDVTVNSQQYFHSDRFQWLRGLRRRSAAQRLLGSWFESHRRYGCLSLVSVCVVMQRSLRRADPSSKESYQLWCVCVCVCVWVWSSKNKQLPRLLWVGRRGKGYETKYSLRTFYKRNLTHTYRTASNLSAPI
jgi:hypothetical protein